MRCPLMTRGWRAVRQETLRRRFASMPADSILLIGGTRVRVRRDSRFGPGPWPAEPTGTVRPSPLGAPFELVSTTSGQQRIFWVVFDEAQRDADGDGPYASAQILEQYLERLG